MSGSVVRAVIDDLATYVADNLIGSPTADALIELIQTYVSLNGNINVPLSAVSVDYETNKSEIEAILATTNSWKDTTNAGTGQTIIQMIATALTYNQFAIVRAAQETMIPTAVIDSSIYTATEFLGVRLARRIPAGQPAILTRTGSLESSLEIDPYTTFIANNVFLFNRETLIFPATEDTIEVTLYEGQAQTSGFVSDGSPYQSFEIGSQDYTISDIDTTVTVDDVPWTRTAFQQFFDIGLWEYSAGDKVFEDKTTPDGNIAVSFGNGINGAIPSAGAVITIGYVNTNGQQGNVDLTGATITSNSVLVVSGEIDGVATGGTNEKTAAEYKTLGPGLFFAKYRAVSRSDQAAIARRYPGVVDAVFEGQLELHPSDLSYMMVTRATILPNTPWLTDEWDAFIAWFSNLNIAQQQIITNDPTAVPIDIDVDVFVKSSTSSLTAIQNLIAANLRAAFTLRSGVLGYSRYLSDIEKVIERTDPSIDYFELNLPTTDTVVSIYEYVTINSITLNMATSTRGTLS